MKNKRVDVNFGIKFKSYLDASGVPKDYYTDHRIGNNKLPQRETDPMKMLLEKKDKYKIKVPENDRNIDLINRIS